MGLLVSSLSFYRIISDVAAFPHSFSVKGPLHLSASLQFRIERRESPGELTLFCLTAVTIHFILWN